MRPRRIEGRREAADECEAPRALVVGEGGQEFVPCEHDVSESVTAYSL